MLLKLQKVSKLRFDFLVSTLDKCFELLIYSNERRLINCVLTFLPHKFKKNLIDSAVAIAGFGSVNCQTG